MEFGSNDWYRFEKKAKTYPAEIFVRFVFIHTSSNKIEDNLFCIKYKLIYDNSTIETIAANKCTPYLCNVTCNLCIRIRHTK